MTMRFGLLDSLLPEMCQTERSAMVHCRREAKRLEPGPREAMTACAEHARRRIAELRALAKKRGATPKIGEAVGQAFSETRAKLADLLVSMQMSYRGTMLGLHHGLDLFKLAGAAAEFEGDTEMAAFCNAWVEERAPLVDAAQRELDWFAMHPQKARERVGTRVFFAWLNAARAKKERTPQLKSTLRPSSRPRLSAS